MVASEESFYADQILITAMGWTIGRCIGVYQGQTETGQLQGPEGADVPVYRVLHVNAANHNAVGGKNHFVGLVELGGEPASKSLV